MRVVLAALAALLIASSGCSDGSSDDASGGRAGSAGSTGSASGGASGAAGLGTGGLGGSGGSMPSICGPSLEAARDEGPFAPSSQTASVNFGHILPPWSLPCTPVDTGTPQNECNHHGSTIDELPDGTVAVVWYHGEFEKSLDSDIVWSKLTPGSTDWTAPEVIYDDPVSDGNPVLWVHEDGTLYVFPVTLVGGGWDDARVRLIRSTDGGNTWSDAVQLQDARCWNARHRPLRLENGDLLLPTYQECVALPTFIRSSDDFATWEIQPVPNLLDHAGQIQPALFQGKESVIALTRDGTGKRRIHRMESTDLGRTWAPSTPTDLPNPGTSIDAVRLENGHVVVVFNNDPDSRYPLSVAVSTDDAKSFPWVRDLPIPCDLSSCSFHYPSIFQHSDGTIWISYTHNRQTIGWVQLNEAWITEGTELAQVGCLFGETCSAGACVAACVDDTECAEPERCIDDRCAVPCGGPEDAECCGECVSGACESRTPMVCAP